MKRTIEFQALEEKYIFKENSVEIFVVDKSNRQLDVKSFYDAFFSKGKDFSEFEFIAPTELNKDDKRIYDAIKKLIIDICSRLKTDLTIQKDSKETLESYKMSDYPDTV